MTARAARSVYRAVLRLCDQFDAEPALKALLSRGGGPAAAGNGCDSALRAFLGSTTFYVPALPSPRSARAAARNAFRLPDGRLDDGLEAMRLLQARPCAKGPRPPTQGYLHSALPRSLTAPVARRAP